MTEDDLYSGIKKELCSRVGAHRSAGTQHQYPGRRRGPVPAFSLTKECSPLPDIPNALAKKYLGGGYGGYALYLFPCRDDRDQAVKDNPAMKRVEPYCRQLFK